MPDALPPEEISPPTVKPVSKIAGGFPAVLSSAKYTFKEMGAVRGTRTLLQLNQKQGIDCPGCAWPEPDGERSAMVRERVIAARSTQLDRQDCLNAQLKPARLRQQARLAPASRHTLERWAEQRGLTARGFHRAWRVARTSADLDGSVEIEERHILEALGFRLQDVAA